MAVPLTPIDRDGDAGEVEVTVVVPTRNRAGLLRDVVGALCKQTFDPRRFEVIVVDNCSEDGTPAVARELAAQAPFRLVYHGMPENRGPARSRNTAARMARGAILAFTDDDCRPHPEWLERGVAALADPAIGFATGPIAYKPEQVGKAGFFARDGRDSPGEHPSYSWTNVLYRRDVFLALGGSDESLCLADFRGRVVDCGDTDLAWRAKEAGHRNAFVPDMLVWHELEPMQPGDWVWEPFRLFMVAYLVKRHPALRRTLLHGGVFFVWPNALLYLAVAGVLGAPWRPASLLLAAPYAAWLAWFFRSQWSLRRAPKLVAQAGLVAARQAALCAGMIYGSIRFRTLVL